jgi:hypothetical protein
MDRLGLSTGRSSPSAVAEQPGTLVNMDRALLLDHFEYEVAAVADLATAPTRSLDSTAPACAHSARPI